MATGYSTVLLEWIYSSDALTAGPAPQRGHGRILIPQPCTSLSYSTSLQSNVTWGIAGVGELWLVAPAALCVVFPPPSREQEVIALH